MMEFKNVQDRQIYLDHPEHKLIVEKILRPALIDGHLPLVFDYMAKEK